MNRPDRHRPLVYVDDLATPQLRAEDERHLRASLRMRADDLITVGDGNGKHRAARLLGDAGIVADGDVVLEPLPASPLTIAFTPVKAQKAEWMITKLTEIGVDVIVPLRTERSVVRWDTKRAAKMAERFGVAAREAGTQSRRAHLPTIGPLASVAEIRAQGARLAEPGGLNPTGETRFIAIGPEGGWSPEELDGADTVALPGGILRAETAVLVAAGVAAAIRSQLVVASPD